jgi:hypothetical protein
MLKKEIKKNGNATNPWGDIPTISQIPHVCLTFYANAKVRIQKYVDAMNPF